MDLDVKFHGYYCNPLHNVSPCLSMWEKLCQPKGQVWPLYRNHSLFPMFGVLMVVGEFVSGQGEENSLRAVIPRNIFMLEALVVVDVVYQVLYTSLRGYLLEMYFYVLGIDDYGCVDPRGSYIPKDGILCSLFYF